MTTATATAALWYLGRGSGVVSLVLLSLVVVLGIATRSGRVLAGLPRFAVSAVHRNAGLLSVVFLAVHVGTLLFDPYAQLRLVDLVLPFAGSYRPLWLGLGTLGLDLVVALVATSVLRARIGHRAWRGIHWLAYGAWPLAMLHGIGTGSDTGTPWMTAVAAVCAATVAATLSWRVAPTFAQVAGRRTHAPAPLPVPDPARSPSRLQALPVRSHR